MMFLLLENRGINLDQIVMWHDDPSSQRLTLAFAVPLGFALGDVAKAGPLEEVFEGSERLTLLRQIKGRTRIV